MRAPLESRSLRAVIRKAENIHTRFCGRAVVRQTVVTPRLRLSGHNWSVRAHAPATGECTHIPPHITQLPRDSALKHDAFSLPAPGPRPLSMPAVVPPCWAS